MQAPFFLLVAFNNPYLDSLAMTCRTKLASALMLSARVADVMGAAMVIRQGRHYVDFNGKLRIGGRHNEILVITLCKVGFDRADVMAPAWLRLSDRADRRVRDFL